MTTTTLRIDTILYEKIVKLALKDKRSINQEIIFILEQYLSIVKWTKRDNTF